MATWVRDDAPFDNILGKYQVAEALKAYSDYGNAEYGCLLDVACSNAYLTQHYLKHFRRVDGVDLNREFICEARKRCPSGNFYVSPVEEFTPEVKYDYVVALNILEHVSNPKMLLSKFVEVLEPDGIIHIQVPNAFSLNRRIGLEMGIIKDLHELTLRDREVLGHVVNFDLEMLVDLVEESGLKAFDRGGLFLKPFSNAQMQFFVNEWRDSDPEWQNKLCEALYAVGKERQDLSALIYVTCRV